METSLFSISLRMFPTDRRCRLVGGADLRRCRLDGGADWTEVPTGRRSRLDRNGYVTEMDSTPRGDSFRAAVCSGSLVSLETLKFQCFTAIFNLYCYQITRLSIQNTKQSAPVCSRLPICLFVGHFVYPRLSAS